MYPVHARAHYANSIGTRLRIQCENSRAEARGAQNTLDGRPQKCKRMQKVSTENTCCRVLRVVLCVEGRA